jgi:hypothetical protein
MAADWDTLIILDGCRYDLFANNHERFVTDDTSYELRSVTSVASGSKEFIERNFRGKELHDTVYVTSNPFVRSADSEVFHAVKNLFVMDWDSELDTVTPDTVTRAATEAHETYPNKRLIVHYMQPHYPFIGECGREFLHRGLYPEDSVALGRDGAEHPALNDVPKRIWGRLKLGEVDAETVWELYRENLEVVVPHVRELLTAVEGKSVVTADHGNLLGERQRPIPVRGYGHPEHMYVPELVTVPWLIFEAERRRNVTAEAPVGQGSSREDVDDETVEDRLRYLGYHD